MEILCCHCEQKVEARLTNGKEIYPHRKDLWEHPYWKCDTCSNYVGCHWKTNNPTKPLGSIPFPLLRHWRIFIHSQLDPLWTDGNWKRKELYKYLTNNLGWHFHSSAIRTIEEAQQVFKLIQRISPNKEVQDQMDSSLDTLFS